MNRNEFSPIWNICILVIYPTVRDTVRLLLLLGWLVIGGNCVTQRRQAYRGEPTARLADQTKVALKTSDGYYLRAVNGGGGDVAADITILQTSGIFTFEWFDKENSKIRFKTRDGYYVHAPVGGRVDAKIRIPLTSEVFSLEWVGKEKMTFRLRTRDGFYMHLATSSGRSIEAKVKKPKAAELFEMVVQE